MKSWLAICLAGVSVAAVAHQPARDPKTDRALADALFTNASLVNLRIEIAPTNVAALRKAAHQYVRATVREGDTVYHDVAIHLKGSQGSFRGIDDKPGLTLNFSAYEASSHFHGLKKVHLNNSVQDGTFMSEWLANQLFREAGVPAPRVAHAAVELNGRKLGLFVLIESNDRDFLARYFKNTRGNVYGQAGGGDVSDALERMEGQGPLDRADLKALTAAAQEPDAEKRWQRLQEKLDVNRFLSFMTLEVLFCHWDGYTFARHNYRVYQDLDSGKMVFFPHDLDQLMGDPNVPVVPGVNGLMAQAVLNTPEGRRRYRERFGQIFTDIFKATELTNRIEAHAAKLFPALAKSFNTNFARDFVNNARGLSGRVMARAQSLQRQLQVPVPKPAQFTNQLAKPGPWEGITDQGNVQLAKTKLGTTPVLYIKCESGNCVASWRSSLILPAGKYRFSGRAKSAGVSAQTAEAGTGGGLRISGGHRKNKLAGTVDWTALEHQFALEDQGEVVLVCELRATKGEIWFDTESLQLERLK